MLAGVAGRAELLLSDGLHPNATGVEELARQILPRLTDLWLRYASIWSSPCHRSRNSVSDCYRFQEFSFMSMTYRPLGRTGLSVSTICLGTMTYGEQNTEADAFAQMDYALEQGVNFFDTAELYAIPPKAETQGRTETYIGNWFKARGNRNKVILASKVAGRDRGGMTWLRKDGSSPEVTKAQMIEALEGSLRRLQTDVH